MTDINDICVVWIHETLGSTICIKLIISNPLAMSGYIYLLKLTQN